MDQLSGRRRGVRWKRVNLGFERFASIALTAQFYVLDDDVRCKDLELFQANGTDGTQVPTGDTQPLTEDLGQEGSLQIEHDGPNGVQSMDTLIDDVTTDEIFTVAPQPPMILNEMDEGLLDHGVVTCNLCRKDICDLSHGAVYYCIYCIDCDICEDCFLKKKQRERGEIEPDWRIICPAGHKHVKAPVEGWRGIKGGMMRFGSAEISFKNWLTQLEIQWTEYWRAFWTERDTL